MRHIKILALLLGVLVCAACQPKEPVCSEGQITYRNRSEPFPSAASMEVIPQDVTLEIKRKPITLDQVVEGQLCNNYLSGTVYVGCDLEIYEWERTSNFLDGCDFVVDPNTVIYVAAHNNAAYYKGCASCHE